MRLIAPDVVHHGRAHSTATREALWARRVKTRPDVLEFGAADKLASDACRVRDAHLATRLERGERIPVDAHIARETEVHHLRHLLEAREVIRPSRQIAARRDGRLAVRAA
eukprot:6012604-Prymnesium_polylepis.1